MVEPEASGFNVLGSGGFGGYFDCEGSYRVY